MSTIVRRPAVVKSHLPDIGRCLYGSPSIQSPRHQKRSFSIESLNATKGDRERVLILGSGWGGFGLANKLSLKDYQPLIITPRTYFVFTPLLASTAVGTLEFRTAMESSRSRDGVEVVRGWAESIDFAKKAVTVEGALEKRRSNNSPDGEGQEGTLVGGGGNSRFEVPFDKVVIGVGAYSQTFGVPGVKEHAFFLKDVADARKIRKRVLECFEEASLPTASEERKKQLLNFAVIGGGPTGVEFSAELHDLVTDDLSRLYPSLASYPKITIYDVAPRILSMFDGNLTNYAERHFHRQGIQIKTSHHVLAVEDGAIITKEEGRIPVGGVVWNTGLAPNPFIAQGLKGKFRLAAEDGEWGVEKDEKAGRVVVDSYLRVKVKHEETAQVKPLEDVFAIGDCAWLEGKDLPATAQVANQQAVWLGRTLNKAAKKNRKELGAPVRVVGEPEFKYRSLGVMAYLGSWKAITQTDKGDVKGRLAWLMWRTAYFTKSVSWRNKILIPVHELDPGAGHQ
ncbi:uncharacterized protein H6S33_013140 [Morchella sextelata]|uniref:uncharacterized protein n=1 Tax=Morchella sextelata TaxID=1174677 RepID=UPI001D0460BC|nr:uncharacterized protein H6S33_013140 [Morchella sextelata]KAH0609654.1 hypothetical protein H6S33_013140 [Morchella sextelata]